MQAPRRLAIAVDRSFNIYRADDLTLAISSSQLEKNQEIAVWHDLTFACVGRRGKLSFLREPIFFGFLMESTIPTSQNCMFSVTFNIY